MQGQQQTYRVTLSDGRSFDVTTDGGPPSEEDVYASLGVLGQPETPEPAVHPHARVGRAGIDALKAGADMAWRASGIPGVLQGDSPVSMAGAGGVVRDALMAQWDQAKKARQAFGQGRYVEAAGHGAAAVIPAAGPMAAHIGESIAEGKVPELVGELGAAVVTGGAKPTALGARDAFKARRARRVAALSADVDGSVLMAVPPSKTTPYTPADFRTAKPYINAQHERAPITSVTAFRDAADNAIGEIEGTVSGIVEAFPEAQLNPWAAVQKRVTEAFEGNPRGTALQAGLKELDDLPLNADLTLPELDAVRLQLNAENRAILKRNSYDVATARKADPGFAAREATAAAIRDVLYDYLEARGVKGVRELRRDEGALIKVRNAAERQAFSGARAVAGSAEGGVVRQALGAMVENALPVPGIVAKPIANMVRGSRKTRDELIARAFSVADGARPTYPTVPKRRPVAGALPPAAVAPGARPTSGPVVGPSGEAITVPIPERLALPAGKPPIVTPPGPDTSGRIPATLPEHYVREQAALDEIVGPARMAAAEVVPAERSFILRWLADDLREMRHERGGSTKGQRREAYEQGESAFVPAGAVAGTPTQEMFHAAGIKGTRLEIAERLDTFVRTGKGSPKIAALADAMREAWDGQRFDFSLISDETMGRLGIRRRDLRSPVTTPSPDDMPGVYERFFPRKGDDVDFDFSDQ